MSDMAIYQQQSQLSCIYTTALLLVPIAELSNIGRSETGTASSI